MFVDGRIQLGNAVYVVEGERPLGQGAYGVVWAVHREGESQPLALKTVQTHAPHNGAAYNQATLHVIQDKLFYEIEFLSRIPDADEHYILPLVDHGTYRNLPALVAPRGEIDMGRLVTEVQDGVRPPFSLLSILTWSVQIAIALARLHTIHDQKGLFVHRDLKLSNVLLVEDEIRLMDFGTIKLLDSGMTTSLAGTPEWAAPELILPVQPHEKGRHPEYRVGQGADVYSLGLILYHLILGELPVCQQHLNDLVTVNGNPVPGAEKRFGQIGGVTSAEGERLKERVKAWFSPAGDGTLVRTQRPGLPDGAYIGKALVELVQALLAPDARNRPSAIEARNRLEKIQLLLNPRLEKIELKVPSQVEFGIPLNVTLELEGSGLPESHEWLDVAVGEAVPVEWTLLRSAPMVWRVGFSPPKAVGLLSVHAWGNVSEGIVREAASVTLEVVATLEQLWDKGEYGTLLRMNPDYAPAVEIIDAAIQEKTRPLLNLWREVLADVRTTHPEHATINRQYFQIIEALSSQPPVPTTEFRPRWLHRAALVLVLLGVGKILYEWGISPSVAPEPGAVTTIGAPTPPPVKLDTLSSGESTQPQGVRSGNPLPSSSASKPVMDPKEARIRELLQGAQKDFSASRWMTPVGSNAVEKYREILKLDSGNTEASSGLKQVGDKYASLAETALAKNNFTKVEELLEKLEQVHPGSSMLGSLRLRLSEAQSLAMEVAAQQAAAAARQVKPAPVASSTGGKPTVERSLGKMSSMLRLEFSWVFGGTFEMGCDSWQMSCEDDERPVQSVTVGNFELGRYEVTEGQWDIVMGWIDPEELMTPAEDLPKVGVSWDMVQFFIKKMNEGGDICRYRLPTEAEWEYACRSEGQLQVYCGGDNKDRVAWYDANSDSKPHPVRTKSSNGNSLFGMSGNVWEWTCSDYSRYDDAEKSFSKCSSGRPDKRRVVRGGSYNNNWHQLRSTNRDSFSPASQKEDLGLRLVRDCS